MTDSTDQFRPPREDAAGESRSALLEHVRSEAAERCRQILDDARETARERVRTARRQTNDRVRRAIHAERSRITRQCALVTAEEQTALRRFEQELATRLLEPLPRELTRTLIALWRDRDNRRTWIRETFNAAEKNLPAGNWEIRHPADWATSEAAEGVDQVTGEGDGTEVEFIAEEGLDAGLRITCGGATLDATPDGFQARPRRIESLLLGLLTAAETKETERDD